jgi:Zn-dependent protease
MGLLNLLINDPLTFFLLALPLLYSIIIHELAHGWVAYRMGDQTAKRLGRLSLNPLKHLDPVGTLMLFIFGFGWAKPVPVNVHNLRDPQKGMILVASAGIIANLTLAFLASLLQRLLAPAPSSVMAILFYYLSQINIMLASFNLIPIPPLDGSKILMGLATPGLQYSLSRLEPYGFFILIGFLYLGVLNPLIILFRSIILSLIGFLLP